MQEFILFYVLPGLVVWLITFRLKHIDVALGAFGTFIVFFIFWPAGVLCLTAFIIMATILSLQDSFTTVRQFLYQDIFKKGD